MKRLTGLQREVLSLYRTCLREARKKPEATRQNFIRFARDEFRSHLSIDRKDFDTIEHLLRVGRRKLEVYSGEGLRMLFDSFSGGSGGCRGGE
ncbi:complex 1 protein-domain-containing protein [Kalaharituber pfeilii]|nr:complex 1 protein-domain-containing protein [Kalaharituber pfeilii]